MYTYVQISSVRWNSQTVLQPKSLCDLRWFEGKLVGPVLTFLDFCWTGKQRSGRKWISYCCRDLQFSAVFGMATETYFPRRFLRILPCFPQAQAAISHNITPGHSQPGGCSHPRRRAAVPHRLALQFQPCAQQGCWTIGRLEDWVPMGFQWHR